MIAKKILILCALASPWCGAFQLKPGFTVAANIPKTPITSPRSVNNNQEGFNVDKSTNYNNVPSTFSKWGKRALISGLLASPFVFMPHQQAFAATLSEIVSSKVASSGFLQAFLLIFVSEIGDKTFFIAGLLAAKYSRLISFTGSIGALAVMTILCTILGQIFHAVPSSLTQGLPFDDYIAVAAFAYFGLKTLKDTIDIEEGSSSGIEEEKAEAEKTVEEIAVDSKRTSSLSLILQTFSLVFAAEIGDKSFLSTIALSAAQNPFSVATGAIAAHASATGIAVIGGAILSKYLSEKTIGYIGGSLFLVFAITTAFGLF